MMVKRKSLNVLALLGSVLLVFSSEASQAQQHGKFRHGKEAIAALGARLPDVARAHRITPEKLQRLLNEDSTLNVDEEDRLLYVDAAGPDSTGTASGGASTVSDAVIPPENAFLLNSKPGALRTIYLNFKGMTLTGTAWNSTVGIDPYNAPPYDTDSIPDTFSTAERNAIISMWRRVVEDFAPFDVNITTQDPGKDAISRSSSSDLNFGTVALITRWFSVCTSCGGVAYYGAFGNTSDYTKPALVFFDKLGNGNEKYTAEAISHELGHNLNLSHDGTTSGTEYFGGNGSGDTGWAPIMGVGYYKPLTQWSKGEYSGANNTQDDFATMQSIGLPIRADDHGNTAARATMINQGSTFGVVGTIEQRTDVDFFGLATGPGEVSLEVVPVKVGANIDLQLTVFDSAGNVIGQANPPTTLGSSLIFNSPGDGVYYIQVDGVGQNDPLTAYSDYASVGQYTLIGTLTNSSGNQSPTAILSASATSGTAPLTITFDGSGSGDTDGTISSYTWDFGDGGSASGVTAQHTFQPGNYTVNLTVADNGGLIDVDSVSIMVSAPPNQPPVAVAAASSTSGTVPFTVNFSSSGSKDSDGSIVSYQWRFGDGGTSNTANPSYIYKTAGTFNAVLVVTDNQGATGTAQVSITVADNPAYIPPPSGLSASASGTAVSLSWADNSSNESGFKGYQRIVTFSGKGRNRTETFGPWTLIATLPANSTSYSKTGLSSGTTYEYQIEAFNSVGGSALSNIARVTTGGKKF